MTDVAQGPGWWQAPDGKWYPPQTPTAAPRACAQCGSATLVAAEDPLTTKKRPKFGFLWVIMTLLTGGLALILYLIWPRHKEKIGVDRYLKCNTCGARQT